MSATTAALQSQTAAVKSLAKQLGCSERSVWYSKKLARTATPELMAMVEAGAVHGVAALSVAEFCTEDEQRALARRGPDAIREYHGRARKLISERSAAATLQRLITRVMYYHHGDDDWRARFLHEAERLIDAALRDAERGDS